MRVWDISVSKLCNKHLIAQHHEIHCIYSIIWNKLNGFSRHPEVVRWRGHVGALIEVHDKTVFEMGERGLKHHSPFPFHTMPEFMYGSPESWQPIERQIELLKSKECGCLK